jgi:hypothetical protein
MDRFEIIDHSYTLQHCSIVNRSSLLIYRLVPNYGSGDTAKPGLMVRCPVEDSGSVVHNWVTYTLAQDTKAISLYSDRDRCHPLLLLGY